MRTLSVIGVEDGAILAADENGERFRIPVDESVRARLPGSSLPPGKRLSPREIQAQVRAGLSAEEVALRTGAPVAYVERFVRPVLAERAFVLESAMRVTVQPDADADEASSFGAVLAERLAALDATDVSWTSLREAGGDWIVSVSFQADGLDHEARWTFDPKRLVLTPDNVEATTLSQQGTPAALTPRLRVLEPTGPVAVPPLDPADEEEQADPNRARFDSAAFVLPDLTPDPAQQGPVEAAVLLDALERKRLEREREAAAAAAAPADDPAEPEPVDEAPVAGATTSGTGTHGRFPQPALEPDAEPEDLEALDATRELDEVVPLRRPRDKAGRRPEPRRPETQRQQEAKGAFGQQPPQPRSRPQQPSTAAPARRADPEADSERTGGQPAAPRARRGRTSLPSWDEIVFGKAED